MGMEKRLAAQKSQPVEALLAKMGEQGGGFLVGKANAFIQPAVA